MFRENPRSLDKVVIPKDFDQDVVIGWGDPLFRNSPKFDINKQTGAAQKKQFGYNNDSLGLLPLGRSTHAMMVNYEYTDEIIMLSGYDEENPTREQVDVAWAAHGLTVVTVKESLRSGALKSVVGHSLNRRFHTGTEFELTGSTTSSSWFAFSTSARSTARPSRSRHRFGPTAPDRSRALRSWRSGPSAGGAATAELNAQRSGTKR